MIELMDSGVGGSRGRCACRGTTMEMEEETAGRGRERKTEEERPKRQGRAEERYKKQARENGGLGDWSSED